MSARPPAVLAVDVGSTSTKAGLVGLDGTILASARSTYALGTDEAGRAEQDPEAWWRALVSVARELTEARVADVVAIVVDGHGPTLTAVDADGLPTRPAITWLDSRASAELAELSAATGLRGWALGVLPLALWVERHESTVAEATRWYLNTWEFLALRLSGRATTTLVPGQSPPTDDVARLGGPLERLAANVPPPIGAGEVVGGLVSPAASALRLPAGVPVVAGVVDAFASFHGAGLLAPGDAIDVGGASGGFGVYWDRPVEAAGSFCTPAPVAGLHVVGGAMAATGRALDWLRDELLGGAVSTERLVAEAGHVDPGAHGLVFLPYLAGERSPIWDPHARGAFAGLALGQGRGHLARAVLEAAAFAIRHVAVPILGAGVTVREMRVCGGPARSPVWNQIKADVTGFTIAVPHALETAVVGSGVLGAIGIGAHADLPSAIRAMTRIDHRLAPRPELRDVYDARFEAYVALYPAIAPVVRAATEARTADPVPA